MAVTSPEVKKALEVIFAADSDIYQTRGFQRRIGYGARPALVIMSKQSRTSARAPTWQILA